MLSKPKICLVFTAQGLLKTRFTRLTILRQRPKIWMYVTEGVNSPGGSADSFEVLMKAEDSSYGHERWACLKRNSNGLVNRGKRWISSWQAQRQVLKVHRSETERIVADFSGRDCSAARDGFLFESMRARRFRWATRRTILFFSHLNWAESVFLGQACRVDRAEVVKGPSENAFFYVREG